MGIGKRIREARRNRGLSRKELADILGVTVSSVGNYETDISFPKVPVLFALFDALQIDANYLFQDALDTQGKVSAGEGDGLSPLEIKLTQLVHRLSDDQKEMLLVQIELLLNKRGAHD